MLQSLDVLLCFSLVAVLFDFIFKKFGSVDAVVVFVDAVAFFLQSNDMRRKI